MRIRLASHHIAPSLKLKTQARPTSAVPPAKGVDPAVIPFLDVLAELGARAVLRDLAPTERFKVRIGQSEPHKPVFRLKPRGVRICR